MHPVGEALDLRGGAELEAERDRSANRANGIDSGGRVETDQTRNLWDIVLPATPGNRKSLAHQEAVARLRWRGRDSSGRYVIEKPQRLWVSPVYSIV